VSSVSKLDIIIENQQEILNLLKHVVSVNQTGSCEGMLEDLFPRRIESLAELEEFNGRLDDDNDFLKKMVSMSAIEWQVM